jgi:hypothetical protein
MRSIQRILRAKELHLQDGNKFYSGNFAWDFSGDVVV